MPEPHNTAGRSADPVGRQLNLLDGTASPAGTNHRPDAASTGRRFSRVASAPGAARGYAAEVLRSWALGPALADDVRLVVTEIVSNAVRHGRLGDIDLHMDLHGDVLRVSVEDRTPYEPLPPATAPNPEAESGRGLFLIQLITERWGHGPAAGDPVHGTEVWAELKVSADGPDPSK